MFAPAGVYETIGIADSPAHAWDVISTLFLSNYTFDHARIRFDGHNESDSLETMEAVEELFMKSCDQYLEVIFYRKNGYSEQSFEVSPLSFING